jgi:Zn ribbon nucleic-acid-binding protein
MSNQTNRFKDSQWSLSHFYDEVWVECPACKGKANAIAYREIKEARLLCTHCGYNKTLSTQLQANVNVEIAAHGYFSAKLWLQLPFRGRHVVAAYNGSHLHYLEQYIAATLREHKDRTHFTLLEKLPRFYHEAKNREPLLKIIEKLKEKG